MKNEEPQFNEELRMKNEESVPDTTDSSFRREAAILHSSLKEGSSLKDRTARGLKGGYADWLSDCLLAIRWALQQPGVLPQMSLFGTSQGGGGSLLLASILGGKVRCVCADLPFLTDFPATELEGPAYSILKPAYEETDHTLFWNQLGYVDTLSHAHRINVPVMLSAGGLDNTCPPKTIEHLFSELDCTKQYTFSKNVVHTHSRESMVLFSAWLHLYA